MDTLDSRLRDRGWRTIVSLRLIRVVPFAVQNYAARIDGAGGALHRGDADPASFLARSRSEYSVTR